MSCTCKLYPADGALNGTEKEKEQIQTAGFDAQLAFISARVS